MAKAGGLIDQDKREWVQVHQLTREIGGRSERIVGNVRTLKALFSNPLLTYINNYRPGDPEQMSFPELYTTPSKAPDDCTGQLLSHRGHKNVPFSTAIKD